MPISKDNYKNFYYGTGSEYYFISKFYMLGYEAYKLNPDIGYDLLVTNKAKELHEGQEKVDFCVQVKSSIMVKENTSFWIEMENFVTLINDPTAVLLLAYYEPVFKVDPKSFDYFYMLSDFPWSDDIDKEIMQQNIMDYHSMTIEERNRIFRFNDFNYEYLWINSKQINRLNDEAYFYDISRNGKDYKALNINRDRETNNLSIINPKNKCNYGVVPEIRNLYYLVNDCRSKAELIKGKCLWEHY